MSGDRTCVQICSSAPWALPAFIGYLELPRRCLHYSGNKIRPRSCCAFSFFERLALWGPGGLWGDDAGLPPEARLPPTTPTPGTLIVLTLIKDIFQLPSCSCHQSLKMT